MKNFRISKKLIICFAIIVLISNVSGILGMLILKTSLQQYRSALENDGFAQGDIGLLSTSFQEQRAVVLYMLQTTDQAKIAELKLQLEEVTGRGNQYLDAVSQRSQNDQEIQQISELRDKLTAYMGFRDEVVKLGEAGRSAEGVEQFRTNCAPISNEIVAMVSGMMQEKKDSGNQLSDSLEAAAKGFVLVIFVIMLASVVLSTLLTLYLNRSIAKPLTRCTNRLKKLAEGDLNSPVELLNTKDETGELSKATWTIVNDLKEIVADEAYLLSEMANGNFRVESRAEEHYIGDYKPLKTSIDRIMNELNRTLIRIDESADQVASGADQVASASQALSQGATEQASSVEELAATIAEISEQVKNNADHAAQASSKADVVGETMKQSNLRMGQMSTAIEEISRTSGEIGKIIKTIEDIAFQTNILALNAAVEAARAGSAGKGFAVVADEVRNLASKSAEASKSTASLIESSIQAVKNGTQMAGETAQALLAAVNGSGEVTAIIDQISEASRQQAESITQVTQGVDQISGVVQTNSATSEESAAASEELSGQAQLLKKLVSDFHLKKSVRQGSEAGSVEQAPSFEENGKYQTIRVPAQIDH